MKVIGLRTKNKDICKETVHDAGFKRLSMINTGFYVPAAVKLLWEWVNDDLGHPKSVRGQGNLNLVALPRVPDELDEKAELVIDYDQLKKNAKSVHSDLLNKRIDRDSRSRGCVYLPPEKIEKVKPDLFDGVLIDSREVPEERTRKKESQDKAAPEFDLQEGDVCSYRDWSGNSSKAFPVVVTRRTSRNVWVEPVKFTAEDEDLKVHPNGKRSLSTYGQSHSHSSDEIKIIRGEDGEPVRLDDYAYGEVEDFPMRFYIDKSGEWREWGSDKWGPAPKLIDSIRAEDSRQPV